MIEGLIVLSILLITIALYTTHKRVEALEHQMDLVVEIMKELRSILWE